MLNIDTVYKRGILFVKMYGVINKKNKYKIEDVLDSAINKAGIKYLLLNFDNIYYINVDISRMISKWNNVLKREDGKIFICGNNNVKEMIINFDNGIKDADDEISAFSMVSI